MAYIHCIQKVSAGYQGTEDLNPQCFYSAVHGRLDPRPTGHEVHARMEQLMSQLTMTTISHRPDYRAGHCKAPSFHQQGDLVWFFMGDGFVYFLPKCAHVVQGARTILNQR